MIQIVKTGHTPPNSLTTLGANQTRIDCVAYTASPSDYIAISKDPKVKFNFTDHSDIYNAADVKSLLLTIQSGKCCFCEARMRHVDDGTVEHFRPKGRYKQVNGDPIYYPGYYWLAYNWTNLYLACGKCNKRHKQDLFPIDPKSQRATNHNSDLTLEKPIFVDPGDLTDNPENHIEFHNQFVKKRSDRGQTTITELGLDITERDEDRWSVLDKLIGLEDSYLLSKGYAIEQGCKDNFLNRLRPHILGTEEYTNMIKCRFQKYIPDL